MDGREQLERALEGRSRKAADNALDRTTPELRRRSHQAEEAAEHQKPQECPTCRGVRWVCENHPDRPWRSSNDFSLDACGCGAGIPCHCNRGGFISLQVPRY